MLISIYISGILGNILLMPVVITRNTGLYNYSDIPITIVTSIL